MSVKKLRPALILILPFIVLYWLVSGFSNLSIGADYGHYPIEAQMEINQSIEHGTFPLYAPGFAGGQSAAAMTLGQAFHPITHIARMVPGYWEGSALTINTTLRLISLGLVHLLVFYMLSRVGLGFWPALLVSFVAVYNLRMLDHFRYGASLENHTAFLALGALIVLYFLNPRSILIGLGLFASSYLLVVGGHPQMTYLGFIATGMLALLAPFFLAALERDSATANKNSGYVMPDFRALLRLWGWLLFLVVLGIACAAPYALTFYNEFLSSTALRTQNPYEWSLAYQDSIGGVLRNFYAPLRSDVMSGFGGSIMFIWVLVAIPMLVLLPRVPKIIWLVAGLFIFSLLLVMGDVTPIHYWIWKFFPMADSFRVPGRYSLWLIFPTLLLSTWLILKVSDKASGQGHVRLLLPGSVILALLVYLIFNFAGDALLPESGVWVPAKINDIDNTAYNAWLYLGVLALLVLAAWSYCQVKERPHASVLLPLLTVLVLAQSALTLRYGTWVEKARQMPTLAQMDRAKLSTFKTQATPGFGLNSTIVGEQLARSFLDPFMAKFYRDVRRFDAQEDMWRFLSTQRKPDQAAVLSQDSQAVPPAVAASEMSVDRIELTRATFNELAFEVESGQQGLFVSNIPFTEQWVVEVDGVPVNTYAANGHALAVFLALGTRQVNLRYESRSMMIGLAISLASALVLIAALGIRSSWRYRFPVAAAAALVLIGFYVLWYQSLYDSGSMDSNYSWTSNDFPPANNLAYGKPTAASSISNYQMPYLYAPSKAVDGDKLNTGFRSDASPLSSWKVDLGQSHMLGEVVIYGLNRSAFPISVYISNGPEGGFTLLAQEKIARSALRIPGMQKQARVVVVAAAQNRPLEIREVEIYSAQVADK